MKLRSSEVISNSVENYKFKDSLNLFMTMFALSNIKRQDAALLLYEKFITEIKESDNEIIGLITTIRICQEKNDYPQIENYMGKLKKIAPDHSFIGKWENN